jgi:hypothetical protein
MTMIELGATTRKKPSHLGPMVGLSHLLLSLSEKRRSPMSEKLLADKIS